MPETPIIFSVRWKAWEPVRGMAGIAMACFLFRPSTVRLLAVPSRSGYAIVAVTCRAPDDNPVVDPVPRANHRVITTVLFGATLTESTG